KKILYVKGLFNKQYDIERATPCTAVYSLPPTYQDLYAYDAVVLANVNFSTADFAVRRLLRDFVADGGRLVILGGNATLGEGGMQGTYLDEISPFAMKGIGEVIECKPPLPLGPSPTAGLQDKPAIFWRHDIAIKPGAIAVAYAGNAPIAARVDMGKGVVVVFAGTVLGEATPDAHPYWQSPYWLSLARKMIAE